MATFLRLVLIASLGVGCTPASLDVSPDGAVAADATVAPDQAVDRWAAVDALLAAKVAGSGIAGLGVGLVVYDAGDHKVFEKMYGDFAPDRNVAIASASKLVSGLVLLDLVARGKLSLDSTTGQVLGWTGPQAAITLRHLLSFTSGLVPENACTTNPTLTLADCVTTISQTTPMAAPGTQFDYGSTHLQTAGRMAEVVTGKTWDVLFDETLRAPLGLSTEVTYYTGPRNMIGTTNPLVAGGMRASMDDYARILALPFHRGVTAALTIASDELFSEQAREPYNVVIDQSPIQQLGYPYRYGLASWLECDTPQSGCQVLSSAGAFGFTPFYDRTAGYYAILAMQIDNGAQFAFPIEQQLEPLIRAALAP